MMGQGITIRGHVSCRFGKSCPLFFADNLRTRIIVVVVLH
jgi:hypothetical protein